MGFQSLKITTMDPGTFSFKAFFRYLFECENHEILRSWTLKFYLIVYVYNWIIAYMWYQNLRFKNSYFSIKKK